LSIFTSGRISTLIKRWKEFYKLDIYLHGVNKFKPAIEIDHANNIRRFLLFIRCILFIITSTFYLAAPPYSPVIVKLQVVLTTLVATILAQNLYDSWDIKTLYHKMMPQSLETSLDKDQDSHSFILLLGLIILEVCGAVVLILPTGGLDSPFIWYALNPIIAAVVYLPTLYCWGTVVLFLTTAITVNAIYPGYDGSLFSFIYQHKSILLVFLITTSLASLASSLNKYLAQAYTWLAIAHETTEKSLEHISSLYQALEAFSTREDKTQLVDVLATYSSKLCNTSAACFLKEDLEGRDEHSILRVVNQEDCINEINWEKELMSIWYRLKPFEEVMLQNIGHEQLIIVPIIAHGEYFGLLACLQFPALKKPDEGKKQSLIFLAGIAGIILERLKTDELWGRLLVSEEQSRIANEIHDGVAQYLFSMVCALDMISKEQASLQDERIQQKLKLLGKTANQASVELRASIYELSPYKRGESIFVDNLASYLDDLGRLNNIQVDLEAEGSEEALSPALRKGLYRIVREACSNAIRHGKCNSIKVELSMYPNQCILQINDNGCGYKWEAEGGGSNSGLGNWNMYQLVTCFNGELQTFSEPGKGTVIRCTIPKLNINEKQIKETV